MRLCIFTLLFFLSGSLNAQSYFNKRYPQPFSDASATEYIVIKGDSLYFNIISLNDSVNRLEQKLTSVSTYDGASTQLYNLVTDSIDYYAGKLTNCTNGGFADAITVAKWGAKNTYGIIKYKPNGDTIFFNTNTDSVLYIYIALKKVKIKGLYYQEKFN